MTTTEEILHIMAGTEPEYVQELRAELQKVRDHVKSMQLMLAVWHATVEEARKYLMLEHAKQVAVESNCNGVANLRPADLRYAYTLHSPLPTPETP